VTLLLRVRRTRPAPAYPDPSARPPRSLALPLESELDHPCHLSSSPVVRLTPMCLAASQLHISQLAGSLILWTRACTTLPSAVLYGGAITSHSPLSSGRRSPTRRSIGRILLSAADFGSRFLEGRGLAGSGEMSQVNSVAQSGQSQVANPS